jgi:hypothetical protein
MPMAELVDLRFSSTQNIDRSYREKCAAAAPSEITVAVSAFKANMDRVVDLSALFHGLYSEVWVKECAPNRSMVKQPILSDFDQFGEVVNHLVKRSYVEKPESAQRGVEAILCAMVTGAWTAFETMAVDLWEECLNGRPELGFRVLGIKDADDDEGRKRVGFPFGLLKAWNFELKNRMGSLLVAMKKQDFQSRGGIARVYATTFGDKKTDVLFDDQTLRWLAATRHCIVHKGSIADDEFTNKVKTHETLKRVQADQRIPITGDLVRELVDSASTQGIALIEFMRDWLNKNRS